MRTMFHSLCLATTLALAPASLALAADAAAPAPGKMVTVKVQLGSKTETKQMTPDALAKMLNEMGMDGKTIQKAMSAAERDGALTIKASSNSPKG